MDHSLQARRRARFLGILVACGLSALALTGAAAAERDEVGARSWSGLEAATHGIRDITVLSNRADLISGGDALVAIDLGDAEASSVTVTLNGHDITNSFAVRENGHYEGLVAGLQVGENVLVASTAATRQHGNRKQKQEIAIGRQITIRNYPIGGPIFAGPQVTPFFCNPNVSNPPLGAAIDAQCNAPTKVEFLYRNTATPAQFVSYDPANPPDPASIAQTTTDAGKTVPFVVQRVTGTADRGIYQIAVLVDPSKPIEPIVRPDCTPMKVLTLPSPRDISRVTMPAASRDRPGHP